MQQCVKEVERGDVYVKRYSRYAFCVDGYFILKTVHIISSTILFGTGLGTAFLFWNAHRARDRAARLYAARATVLADWLFTLPSAIMQPLSGVLLVWRAGHDWSDLWLAASYGLYALAGLCWVLVVILQLQMRAMLEGRAAFDNARYQAMLRTWFWLGWPAFGALVLIFWLMVAKPSW